MGYSASLKSSLCDPFMGHSATCG